MYKKVYIEVTNKCNLKCPFCTQNKREGKFISLEEFADILTKLKGQTKHLYLHVLGEPLLHPKINELISMASSNYEVNITTNGYLIDRLDANLPIRQINISLHSFTPDESLTLSEYMNKLFSLTKKISDKTYINYRLWIKNKYTKEILSHLSKMYHIQLDPNNLKRNTTLSSNVFLNIQDEFVWPSDSKKSNVSGPCYALRDHIAILVDGTVVPCCLDADGYIKLGNIYKDTIDAIKNTSRYQQMLEGFKENKRCEELCQRCDFIEK